MKNPIYLELISKTASHQSDELFDYHSRKSNLQIFKINESASIYRTRKQCYIQGEQAIPGHFGQLKIERKGDEFLINAIEPQFSEKLWIVINESSQPKGYRLSEGDYLKLGEVSLLVKKICLIPQEAINFPISEYFHKPEYEEITQEYNSEILTDQDACRICLDNLDTPNDPLFSPCGCTGSMKSIHLLCLKQWIQSKTLLESSAKCQSFHLASLKCELCGFDLPISFKYHEKITYLLQIQTPVNPFIIFEEFRLQDLNKFGLHYLSLRENHSGIIGRANNCDLRILDKTVSRMHCQIKYIKGSFYIKDSKSKFGTLAKVNNGFVLGINEDVMIQIDKTVFHMVYRQPRKCCKICTYFSKKKGNSEREPSITNKPSNKNIEHHEIHTIMNESYMNQS